MHSDNYVSKNFEEIYLKIGEEEDETGTGLNRHMILSKLGIIRLQVGESTLVLVNPHSADPSPFRSTDLFSDFQLIVFIVQPTTSLLWFTLTGLAAFVFN